MTLFFTGLILGMFVGTIITVGALAITSISRDL